MKCAIDKGKIVREGTFVELTAFNKKGQPVGHADAGLYNTDKKFVWLHEIHVRDECRRKGVATEMIGALAEFGKMKGAQLLYAYPAPPQSDPSVPQKSLDKFYRKNGFKPCNAPKDAVTITDEGLFKRGVCLPLKAKQ